MKSDRSRLAVCRSDRADRLGLFASCFADPIRHHETLPVADRLLVRANSLSQSGLLAVTRESGDGQG
jgi:hypothetical protein